MKQIQLVIALFSVAGFASEAPADDSAKETTVDFARQIQPIFARRCFKCHGPNEDEAGLQLSSRDSATSELDSGDFAVVPGDPEASTIVYRVRAKDEYERMPPEGKPLEDEEIELIRRWIDQGAHWAEHWSYRKPERPPVPQPKNADWVRNPVDAFILKRLEDAGLEPARPADKVALIRRAYYDLIGLPPTPRQVDAFLADDSPQAFEKVVDRLLKAPQYGEKWARHWLDLVRYAETNGYERDSRKDLIWKYRDYVIRALNEDQPFDRFILEQLAGDELPDKDADSIIATGYYRLGIWDDEPADRQRARYDYLDDILRTTGETFLGMTIGCARCHDHKIDPIAQKDYYSMLSFFSDISPHGKGSTNHVPTSSAADRAEFERKVAAKQKREMELEDRIAAIESEFLAALPEKHPELQIAGGSSRVPARHTKPSAGVVLSDSIDHGQVWNYAFNKPADNWFEIAFDDSKWESGPGGFGAQGTPGSVVRTNWRTRDIWLRKDFRLEEIPQRLKLKIHHDEDAEIYLNGKLVKSLKHYTVKYHSMDISESALDVLQTGRNTLAIHCRQTGGGQYIDAGLIADFSRAPVTVLTRKYGKEILGSVKLADWNRLRRELAASKAEKLELKTEYAMAVAERGRNKTWILGRGNPTMQGEEVGPAFPQSLSPPRADVPAQYQTKSTSGKRRVLAEWIASDDNPATARVAVNRIWQHHFGRGIVRSSSDFGFQGTPPTHPQLLDWLASEFKTRNWRMKSLHKLIMMSNAYQMSSEFNESAAAIDPTNDLFWRFNMRRLTAEELRDSILAVSGVLNLELYGPSVYPPLPKEVLATASRPNAAWGRSPQEDAARRSIYVHVKRSLRPPMLKNFDAPDTDTPCAVRVTTTVPTQSLGMLNSRYMNDQAGKLAARLQSETPDDIRGQVALAIRLTTGRRARAEEVQADLGYIADLRNKEQLSLEQAMQHYCLMILNTNEFVYLD